MKAKDSSLPFKQVRAGLLSQYKPFKETGVKGAGSSLANAEAFIGLAGSSRSRLKLSISPARTK